MSSVPSDVFRLAHKRQHIQKGRDRMESKRYYRRHRTEILLKTKRRYRKIRRSPALKRYRKRYDKNPKRYERRRASDTLEVRFWAPEVGFGWVTEVGADGEVTYRVEGGEGSCSWERFVDCVYFLEENDLEEMINELDEAFELEEDLRAVSNACVAWALERAG